MASAQKLQGVGGTSTKPTVGSTTKFFVKPAPQMAPTTKINVGGVVMEAPSGEPLGRMASGGSGGSGGGGPMGDQGETLVQEQPTTETGFNWTWVIVGVVAVVVLWFVFKKK